MTLATHRAGWVIVASFAAALGLSIVPLPAWAGPFRPEWAALVLIYWCLALPHRVAVGAGWLVGLLLDVLEGGMLGQHALGLTLVAYLAVRLHQRIRVFPLWQQALTVLMLLALHQLVVAWTDGIAGLPGGDWRRFGAALTGMLLWPWVFAMLRGLRRRFGVS